MNGKLSTSGGSLSGAITINKTAANKTSPIYQDLVINYSLPSGGTLTEKNAPGIGFHIGNVNWANFIYDGTFKFVNNNFTGYAPIKASSFTGALKGNADTATALTSKSIGSSTRPVYFDANGKPVATTYTLGKSVPSDAKFTDTTYTFNGAVSTIKDSNLTASRALISNSSGKVAVSAVTSTELGYLDGVTSNIQTQLNGKAPSSHTHTSIGNITTNLELIGLAVRPTYKMSANGTTDTMASYNLARMNDLGRTTAVNASDTNYTTYMARGIAAGTTDLTAGSSKLTSGCIYLVYE